MISSSAITDLERAKFLEKLSAAARPAQGIMLTPWEVDFVDTFNRSYRYWQFFTEGRRVATDRMWMNYGNFPEVGMPFPVVARQGDVIPSADAGCCDFLIFGEDRRQQPCNAPATQMRQNGFKYCEAHAEAVQRDLKRHGKTIILIPFHQAKAKPSIPVEAKEIVVREHVTFPKFT